MNVTLAVVATSCPIATSLAFAVTPVPPITLTVAEPPSVIAPPPVIPVPAVTVTASSANLAIGISSLSISATITAANPSVTASASNVPTDNVEVDEPLMFPLAVMCPGPETFIEPETSNASAGLRFLIPMNCVECSATKAT